MRQSYVRAHASETVLASRDDAGVTGRGTFWEDLAARSDRECRSARVSLRCMAGGEWMAERSRTIARLQFLGALRIEIGTDAVTPDAERLFAMIVRLSVPLGRMTSRQTVIDSLWPGVGEANGRHNLRQTVYKARELGLVVESGEDGLRLDPRHWMCDWDEPVGDVAGEWLPGYEPGFSDELTEWLATQRAAVHALVRPRIIRSLQAARAAGDLTVADRYAAQLLGIDTLNEEATLTRAELMAMQGAKVDALKLLDAYLAEIGRLSSGRDAALPAQLLRRRIAEKLPAVSYGSGGQHHGPLVGREQEFTRLIAALFDARAGRGAATVIHGGDGTGKSRLLHELKKSAVLQGMRVVELTCESTPAPVPCALLRTLVRRLMDLPGAMGVSPEALRVLRGWVAAEPTGGMDAPLVAIEDLLAAVSEETPLLVQVERGEWMDGESRTALNLLYRAGLSRHHLLVTTSAVKRKARSADGPRDSFIRLSLPPLAQHQIEEIVRAYGKAERPGATEDQFACASLFAEGIPMYAIEMLGLLSDVGSPDAVPFRVRLAVERAADELSQLQWRLLALCRLLGDAAHTENLAAALRASDPHFTSALDELELAGYVTCANGALNASALLANSCTSRVAPSILRTDSLRAVRYLQSALSGAAPEVLYACVRLLIAANEEAKAIDLLTAHLAALLRRDKAESISAQCESLTAMATSPAMKSFLSDLREQVQSGAKSWSPVRREVQLSNAPSALPAISPGAARMEHRYARCGDLKAALLRARDPNLLPTARLAEASMALILASNLSDGESLHAAQKVVESIRHAPDVGGFDIARADLIFSASVGRRENALEAAQRLVIEARQMADVQLACRGFRNSAEVFSTSGSSSLAQAILLESRALAASLGYHAQIAWADIDLARTALYSMDLDAAQCYLQSAQDIAIQHELVAPLMNCDISLFCAWHAIMRGDLAEAKRATRIVMRRTIDSTAGTAYWATLSVKLATHRGKLNNEVKRDFAALKASIGSRPHYADEPLSLAALLLFARHHRIQPELHGFVRTALGRIEATGRPSWPFLLSILDREMPAPSHNILLR